MLTFDRADFEQNISLTVKKKVKLQTKWNVFPLKEFVNLQNGFAFKSADYVESSNVLNFRQANIRLKGVLDLDYKKTFLPDNFSEKYKDFILKDGDIVIAMTDMNSDLNLLAIPTIFKNTSKTTFLLNQRVGKFINFKLDKIIPSYLNSILKSEISRTQLRNLGFGSVQFNLSKTDLLNFKIPLPPLNIQQKIVDEIEVLEKNGAEAFLFGERGRFAPKGIAGGEDAAMNVFSFEQDEGWEHPPLASKCAVSVSSKDNLCGWKHQEAAVTVPLQIAIRL